MQPLRVASLNLASCKRDEGYCPLAKRLPAVIKLLQTQPAEIICLQEVRATAGLSVEELLMALADGLADQAAFGYDSIPVNVGGAAPFHRAVLFDSNRVMLINREVVDLPNVDAPDYGFSLVTYQFADQVTGERFDIVNCHAPMAYQSRLYYWRAVAQQLRSATTPTVAVGDLNKFPDDREDYDSIFQDCLDFVPADTITFVGFPGDCDPSNKPWRSSLDAVLVNTMHTVGIRVEIISTEFPSDGYRPSDHFYLRAHCAF